MNLFVNTSNLYNRYQDCCTVDVSETIERDCLSVLHKLHDQVNGLQLVQVVVQPLARLFNPASLAALAANQASPSPSNVGQQAATNQTVQTSNSGPQNANQVNPNSSPGANILHESNDAISPTATSVASTANLAPSNHSRSASFASAFNASGIGGATNTSQVSSSSTYMMSPDTAQALIARLDSDRDVNWLMEIIGYGLSMPFSLTGEQDSVKDCCTIYCEWLISALLPYDENNEDTKYQQLSKLVPVPIRQDPNRYARKMLSHLYNVFLPRQMLINPASAANQSQKEQSDAMLTAVSRQAVLCHRVLRIIENIAQNQSNLMDDETWFHLLALLLTVNDKLLSAPTEPDDIGTQLHDRILGVLFDLVLLASVRSIPTPSLWRTFHEMCMNWRHRPALVDHWRRITLMLTKKLATSMSEQRSQLVIKQEVESPIVQTGALEAAIGSMTTDTLSQTWFRFLNLIGNPVDISDPNVISRTDEFYHSACSSNNVLDPRQHPCLNALPQIFLNAMTGIREFCETFLGSYATPEGSLNDISNGDRSARPSIVSLSNNPQAPINMSQPNSYVQPQQAVTPTQSRKAGIKSMSMKSNKANPFNSTSGSHPAAMSPTLEATTQLNFAQQRPSLSSFSSRTSQSVPQLSFRLFPDRPKCNSLLHIFGDWLFSAALVGSDLNHEIADPSDGSTSESAASFVSSSTTTEVSGSRGLSPSLGARQLSNQKSTNSSLRSSNQSSKQNDNTTSDKILLDPPLSIDSFESGQAEAMAILCMIFASKSSAEDISPSYLSRFYLCLQHCLTFGTGHDPRQANSAPIGSLKRQLLAGVLLNSTNLLQRDLDGFNLLIPCFIKAIEYVFDCNERDTPVQPPPRQHSRSGSFRHGASLPGANVTNSELRKACILTLVNLLAYPLHFQNLVIRSCLNESSPTITFASLRPRLLKLLFVALQTEKDPVNMQVLFGGLSVTIHDLVTNRPTATRSDQIKAHSPSSSLSAVHESTGGSLDSADRQDDSVSQNSFVFNSNSGFLIKSLHVTCHLLINIWKHDTQVSLVALELLTSIARISTAPGITDDESQILSKTSRHNNNNDRIEMRNEYKQTTKWICDYICNQCSRPPPAHSRDMHSTIVAAYQCLSVWFYNHPYLLEDESCVTTLIEVVELGVSGQKSKCSNVNSSTGVTTQSVITKANKIMKPSSMRVREAAESLLNICMVRGRIAGQYSSSVMASFDTILDESALAEMFGGNQYRTSMRQIQDLSLRQSEAYKHFKYFSDEDSIIFALLEGPSHDTSSKDAAICLLRTPFGRHCWKLKFNLFNDKSCDKVLANKTIGLIKRPFQQSITPTQELRIFPFVGSHNKSLYINSSARFFPESIDHIEPDKLDRFVTSLEDYINPQAGDQRVVSDVHKINKIISHQIVAEQKVVSESSSRNKRVECEAPQAMCDLEVARIIATQLGLKTCLTLSSSRDAAHSSLIEELKSLDQHSVRICDSVSIFYVRRGRTNAKEILESVRARHNVSLEFFEWILELGQPTVVKSHNRWTGKLENSWTNRYTLSFNVNDNPEDLNLLNRNQMLTSDHGGAIFDGDRMTLYWSDMCQELAFLVPHKIERSNLSPNFGKQTKLKMNLSEYDGSNLSDTSSQSPTSGHADARNTRRAGQHNLTIGTANIDQSSDSQSICSVASDASSISARAALHASGLRDQQSTGGGPERRDSACLSRQSTVTQKKRSTHSAPMVGCDTNIIICWLETSDDIDLVPTESLLSVAENGYLIEFDDVTCSTPLKSRDFVKYFISSMKNGLYRINLSTSFGRHWLALPLVDGMIVSRAMLSSLIRESILNLCRRRRLDADSYQSPHVKRRLKIQEICNNFKISSRYEPTEYYYNLFKNRAGI